MYFPPEIGSAAHLFYEFAYELTKRGNKVTVVTTFPRRFNLIKKDLHLMSKYRRRIFLREQLNGIEVIRLRSLAPQRSPTLRGMEHFFVFPLFLLGGLFAKSDVIVVYSPPLPIGLAGWFLSKIKKAALDFDLVQKKFNDYHTLNPIGRLQNRMTQFGVEHIRVEMGQFLPVRYRRQFEKNQYQGILKTSRKIIKGVLRTLGTN